MTEGEKRQLALSFFQQEQQKLKNRSAFVFDQHNATVEARVQRSANRQRALSVLARNGITWEDLKAAYDENYEAGQRDMVDFRMTFFYSSAAIALHETFSVPADSILMFLERVAAIMGEEKSVGKIKQKALDITGVDVAYIIGNDTSMSDVRNWIGNGRLNLGLLYEKHVPHTNRLKRGNGHSCLLHTLMI